MRKKRKNFKILVNNLLYGYKLLCLNEALHKKVGVGKSTYYGNFKEVWDEILVSLEILYLLELAKVFDNYKSNKRSRKIVSIHDFFSSYEFEFRGYLKEIKKVMKMRHQTIAHTNQNAARNLKRFFEKLEWKHTDARPLFEKTIDVLNDFTKLNKFDKDLKSRFEEMNLRIQEETERFVSYSDREYVQKITLQRATVEDVDMYLLLEKSVGAGHAKTYSGITNEKEAREEIEKNVVYLIRKDDQVVGTIQYQLEGKDCVHITGLVVDPRFQAQGIGREALTRILDELKDVERIDLVTHPHNTLAIMLYLSFGFVIESWKDNYFGDGEPRIVLSRGK